jgi:type IV pilus assembly protein PilQ
MIRQLDVPTSQVLIKAEIVEATRGTARDLGVQWGGMGMTGIRNKNNLWITPGGTGGASPNAANPGNIRAAPGYTSVNTTGLSGQGFGINFPGTGLTTGTPASLGLMFGQIGGNILEMQLRALQEARKVNIVSSPSITTMDGLAAMIESGRDVPFQSVDDSGQIKTEYKSAVLKLDVTPHVISGEVLKLDLEVTKDEPDFTTTVQGNPLIVKKQAKTTLVLYSGETAVIAGLNTITNRKSDSGVPWFMEVPILGWLFKEKGTSEELDDLLVFVTPTILPQRGSQLQKGPVSGSLGRFNSPREGPNP